MPTFQFSSSKALIATALLWHAAWAGGRLIFACLTLLEPLVRFTLTTLATLGIFVTIVFGFLLGAKNFPTWFMLGMALGCLLLLGAYYAVMRGIARIGNVGTFR
jgi:hypothetical protein